MSKPKLFIDMDETIVNFLGSEALKGWDGVHNPPAMYEQGFFQDLRPLPGALKAVYTLLQSEKFDIHILTKPVYKSPDSYSEKVKWIASYIPDLLDKVIMTQDKSLIEGGILIDDDAKSWKDSWKGTFIHFNRKNDSNIQWERITHRLLKEVDNDKKDS